jgi:hypothetical protein
LLQFGQRILKCLNFLLHLHAHCIHFDTFFFQEIQCFFRSIRQAIEELFEVKVESINIIKVQAKPKRRGLIKGEKPGWKKAIVQLREGNTIAQRLDLRVAQMELWSAEASVLVYEERGAEAAALIERAVPALREAGFRPLLLRTLIDAGYASYQTRDQVLIDRVHDEIYDLVDSYPGYAPLVALMNARLAKCTGDAESARRNAQEAKRLGEIYQNSGVTEEASILVPE